MAVVSFEESAVRHWKDAESLKVLGRFGNAGQLLGFSAECGLKALYRCLGILPPGMNGDVDWDAFKLADEKKWKKYHAHVDKLCQTTGILSASPESARYAAMIQTITSFSTWSIDQRYSADVEHERLGRTDLPKWETAAREVQMMLDQARKDGKIA
jgi:hypothetical protein